MLANKEHGLDYRGSDLINGVRRDFVKCTCGEKLTYTHAKENPWNIISAHVKEMKGIDNTQTNTPEETKHEFDGTLEMGGLKYVRCSCGWQKKFKPSQAPKNVWEGHRGFFENKERKQAKQRGGTQSRVKQAAKNFWYGNSWDYGYKKANWEKIEPIANEIFGGTFFVVSTDT